MDATETRTYITGNTYPVKDQLKAAGCRWDGTRKAWYAETPEVAAKAAAIVQPHPLYNSPPPQDLGTADPAALAAKFGRKAIEEAKVASFTGHGKDPEPDGRIVLFSGKRLGGKRFVQVGHGRPRYYSRDMLEDFDMFGDEPGYQYQWDGVEVEPTDAELAADQAARDAEAAKVRAAAEAKARAEADAAQRTRDWESKIAGLERCTSRPEGAVDTEERFDWPKSRDGSAWATKFTLPDGSTGWRHEISFYDDSRTYYYVPSVQATAARLRWAEQAGITPESAAEFLAKYDGCEGTDVNRAVVEADDATKDRLRAAAAAKEAADRAKAIDERRDGLHRAAKWALPGLEIIAVEAPAGSIEEYVDRHKAITRGGSYRAADLPRLEGVVVRVKAPAPPAPTPPKRGKKATAPVARTVPAEVKLFDYCTANVIIEGTI